MSLAADPFRRMGAALVASFANATADIGAVAGVRVTFRRRPQAVAVGSLPASGSEVTLTCRTADLAAEPAEPAEPGQAVFVTDADGAITTWECVGRQDDADTGITRLALTEPVAP